MPEFLTIQTGDPVSEVLQTVPNDIEKENLLIPRFDLLDAEDGAVGTRRDFIVRVNKAAKRSNTTLNEIVSKAYPYPYKMVSLSEVESLKAEGYTYFLDMVLMPKQMKTHKVEAMVPAYEKYQSANRMYNNRNTQFHYYFYIRNLQTDEAFISTRFKGSSEAYPGIKYFLKQIVKERKDQ
ncbi:MAG: hypothetical protein R3B93_27890 [Bacteroidia bacterium]